MKIQDLVFLITFGLLVSVKSYRLSTAAGLACLILAIPLFRFWIFFTAERLTWYAAAFFLYSIILLVLKEFKS